MTNRRDGLTGGTDEKYVLVKCLVEIRLRWWIIFFAEIIHDDVFSGDEQALWMQSAKKDRGVFSSPRSLLEQLVHAILGA